MQVIVHGGAGADPDEPAERQATLDRVGAAGAREGSPTEAVVAAVSVLEASPKFNAGVGGAIQSDGIVRTDAGIMRSDRAAGAACGMTGVRDAVSVARLVMEETPHVLLAGENARTFADSAGVETDCDLLTARTEKRWDALDPPAPDESEGIDARLEWVRGHFGATGDFDEDEATDRGSADRDMSDRAGSDRDATDRDATDHDTVGAVAVADGAVAAATSTGGRWCALAGRVGDVPQIGSGFFCAPAGGASATGAGENIAKVNLSRRAVDALEEGHTPEDAADLAIEEFAEITGSEAGVIVANPEGRMGAAFNSAAMQVSRTSDAE
jgi:beta-aspartyl-peptidase (threonine type)